MSEATQSSDPPSQHSGHPTNETSSKRQLNPAVPEFTPTAAKIATLRDIVSYIKTLWERSVRYHEDDERAHAWEFSLYIERSKLAWQGGARTEDEKKLLAWYKSQPVYHGAVGLKNGEGPAGVRLVYELANQALIEHGGMLEGCDEAAGLKAQLIEFQQAAVGVLIFSGDDVDPNDEQVP